jgi:serine protease Do
MKQRILIRSLVAASMLAAFVGSWYRTDLLPSGLAQAASPSSVRSEGAAPVQLPGFSGIVEKYGPAVVNITVIGDAQSTAGPAGIPGLDPDDPMYPFFKRFQVPVPRESVPLRGVGSGFIVSADGIILTNAHVVDGAKEVNVKLTDKREFKAEVLGTDPQTDVAVVKIAASHLPVVKLGDPSESKVGEWVLAIGSPFGFENTATAGIISAKGRALPDDNYVPFIQTDVAVNPGNSGGPLFNLKGEVIGINSQIFSRSGGYQGLSFAVPIDVARKVEQELVASGSVTRGRIGVTVQGVDQALADSFNLTRPMGALVSAVEKGGPADRAGLEPGDVIVKFNGKEVNDSFELPAQVANMAPGATARIEIIRSGAPKSINITVGELRNRKSAARAAGNQEQDRLGLAVRPLQPDEQKQAGVRGGLLVEDAVGPAARAGIQPGDVILSVNGTSVRSAEQLRAAVGKAGKHIALLVQREDARIFVPIEPG